LLLAFESISLCMSGRPGTGLGPPSASAAAIAAECADLGYGYQLADQPDRAEDDYRQAIALAPANAYHDLRLGDARPLQNRTAEARDAYRQALAPGARLSGGVAETGARSFYARGMIDDMARLWYTGATI
jgi:tetratricopeptide (TPR) repeat protein